MKLIKEGEDPNIVVLPIAGPMMFVRCHVCHGSGYRRWFTGYGPQTAPCPACAGKGQIPYQKHAEA